MLNILISHLITILNLYVITCNSNLINFNNFFSILF